MIGKLFGSKKPQYFLELSEEEIAKAKAKVETAVDTLAESVADKASAAATQVVNVATEAAEAVAEVAETAVESLEKGVAKRSAGKQSKRTSAKSAEPMVVNESVAASATPDPIDIIRNAIAKAATPDDADAAAIAAKGFATDYLLTNSMPGRRMGGPSLAAFKDMAKGMGRR